ncbi:MOSC domain-containing protein [Roseococcus suduntuyensis]|uniref:MOSC domain-containing protein n=1 Tax=Roseococcus suduntuyensis TaxID=455361 RepID=A0A840A7S3_9PROT|nr:MOSC domain-containing protein [Roseococcus suduntuyensis]MBB3896576.1 hypothetical protein [Roseococcus suduntuyensis]
MRVEHIYRYPVKGFSAEALEEVALTPGQCLPHDRVYALAQGDSPFDTAAPVWMRKTNFACLAANARIAKLHTAYDPKTSQLVIRPPEGAPLMLDLGKPADRARLEDFITDYLGEEARGRLRLAEAPGYNFTDIPQKSVSIISLASLAALERAHGMRLDPLRFRANIYVSGGAEWADFDLMGQEIQLGTARLRVWKRIVRCPATEVNPDTAERDARPPRVLRENFGHADLGVQAEVLEGGRVAVGDALEVFTPA